MKKLILFMCCSFLSVCAFAQVHSVPPEVYCEMLRTVDTNDRILLDIRTPVEFEEHRIKGAINIDIRADGFREKIERLDKSKIIFIYCLRSIRTQLALEVFLELGFERVIDLQGGIIAWLKADLPICSPLPKENP